METIKEQILEELTQLIKNMINYEDDASKKMMDIDDQSSMPWYYYQSGKFSGMSDAVMMTLTTKFAIRKLLDKLPD